MTFLVRHLSTLVTLMTLLGCTILLAHIDLGLLNVPLSMVIASIKALLVGLFFMNLKQSDGIHRVFAAAGLLLFLALFLLSLTDYITRGWLSMSVSSAVA